MKRGRLRTGRPRAGRDEVNVEPSKPEPSARSAASDTPAEDTSLARGVPGAEPPPEQEPVELGKRVRSAAGFTSIYETARLGFANMGVGRTFRTLLKINQKDGFDCPSCAWPDPDGDRKIAEFCENGAKAVSSEATLARAEPAFFAAHSISSLLERSDYWLEQQGRITQPMLRERGSDHYVPIEWDEAFALVAGALNGLASPNEAAFYTSGRASNEAAFLYGLFARQFGTNNLPDCSNMCHESSGTGLSESIGIGKATVKIEDFAHADAIFVVGQNPGTCHPRMLTELQKAARNGCKIVSVNPLAETGLVRFKNPQEPLSLLGAGTPLACLFLPVRINGDVALLKGIMKEMLDEDRKSGGKVLAHDFIREQTEGFEELCADLDRESWERIVEHSGVARELIRKAAEIAMESKRTIFSWAMGVTQHKNGVANVQTIANFALMRGQIGRRGAGLCPVRGHSNVQGDRTVGIWEKMSDAFLDALGKEFSFEPPRRHGADAVGTIRAMHAGRVKVFVALGGNFLSATPDTNYTAEALARTELTVQVSTKLNRGHLITGKRALILPCLGRTERDVQKGGEQFVSVEDTTGVVHASRGNLPPASPHLKSECAIVAGIAERTLKGRTKVDWQSLIDDYDRVREHIEHVVPGFARYNQRVREPGGFYLPNGPRDGSFPTKSGRARFVVHPLPEHELLPGELLLTTIRSHDQFNTTIYGEADRYRGVARGRRVLFVNRDDLTERGLADGGFVDLVSRSGGELRRAAGFRLVAYEIPRGCVATYFPEANVLVPVTAVADRSGQPASKSVIVKLEKAAS
ncbi:MAG TPA: FdhF/YdeP family oxidoreductase [Polyangiaceae bacterium]|nr:FdhF/YdeP family oxidoreductase [Polyangiaceae bacterium]